MTLIASPRVSNRLHLRNRLPRPPFTVNKDSPQARALDFWFPVLSGDRGILHELVREEHASYDAANIGISRNKFGSPALDFLFGPAGQIQLGGLNDFGEASSEFTVVLWAQSGGTTGNLAKLVEKKEGIIFNIKEQFSSVIFQVSSSNATVSKSITDDVPHQLVLRYDGTDVKGYVDFFNTASAAATQPGTTDTSVVLGTALTNEDVMLWDARFYTTVLSDAEIYHSFNPATRWDLYYELGRRTFFFPSVAAPGGGLPAGSLALMGVGV